MKKHCATLLRLRFLLCAGEDARAPTQNLEDAENSNGESSHAAAARIFRLIESNQRQRVGSEYFQQHTLRNGAAGIAAARYFRCANVAAAARISTKVKATAIFRPNLEFSLRAFQSRLGIPPNGRLDMDTLAALGLLPGQHGRPPMEIPHRRIVPSEEPPVRGEWIH